MSDHSLEYILSGCSYMRLTFDEPSTDVELNVWINDVFKNMATEVHDFSLLYNGWTEAGFGPRFMESFRNSIANIAADSGGLQLCTQGKVITPDIKDEVYRTQANHSTLAMSFDEIPVTFTGERSSRTDYTNRYFDISKFADSAILTGKNVARQIEVFLDEKSTSKPIFIAQGNCLDTYMEWCELALKQIPKAHHKYIGGVAMGAAALGYGALEDIQKAFYFKQLPLEHEYMHLLGVGSAQRMLPTLVFLQNGFYDGTHISYDSTTHSSGVCMGRYTMPGGEVKKFPKHFDRQVYTEIYEDVKSKFPLDFSVEIFYDAMTLASLKFQEKYGDRINFFKTVIGFVCKSVYNFQLQIEDCLSDKSKLLKLAQRYKSHLIFKTLYDVKTVEDFKKWESELSRFIKTKSIASEKRSTLEDFF